MGGLGDLGGLEVLEVLEDLQDQEDLGDLVCLHGGVQGVQVGLLEECHRGVGPPGGLVGCPRPGRWALGGPGGQGCRPGAWPPRQERAPPPSPASGLNTPLQMARGEEHLVYNPISI